MELEATEIRWWLWPNVLAFDAPAVAVIWQRFLAAAFGVSVPVAASVVLALVVWGIYLVDRWLDARRANANQPRHRFAAKNSKLITTLAVFAFLVAGSLALVLPWAYFIAGGLVAGLVTGYLGLVHLAKAPLYGGKELLVALLFAAGVAIPLIASDVDVWAWLPAVGGFGLACWLNCRLIERWESSPTNSAGWEMCLGLPIVACGVLSPRLVGIMLGMSAGLLLMLHVVHRRTGLELARVLADVALLTPLVEWFLSSGM